MLLHRDEKTELGKLSYEFMGPYDIIGITPEGPYQLKRVRKILVNKAAKEQLRK